ncbi:hypothetical protein [Bradyrhizobium prioriisuperbiae]|uniref:hypothetical protein n=1 Tax=Bradyrhizobium prioriisuperbiae TaxID=2854389 RepID=UPI0028EE311B|nr:hypothetical protein [Bradyrhizobium prioritasuperba]
MSEYQYYEFQAVDRPLTEADRAELRKLSSRARITATSFTNDYQWGDFKGDPAKLMARWFDLHLYVANWGSHRLMIRLPLRLVDRRHLDDLLRGVDGATLTAAGEHLVLDIIREEVESDEEWDDGAGWLAALAPLRTAVLSGDLRLFYLLWLMAVEDGTIADDVPEPLPGIGPMTGALDALADFLGIAQDLIDVVTEGGVGPADDAMPQASVRKLIAGLSDNDKTSLLARVFAGEPHVASELRALLRKRQTPRPPAARARTAGELRAGADAMHEAREQQRKEQRATEERRQAAAQARAERTRLDAIRTRGEAAWHEVETEIQRSNAGAYARAANLLRDLKAIAEADGTATDFSRRLSALRTRHARKERFIARLAELG